MKKLIATITMLGLLIVGTSALAHGGRTDKDGCHYDSKTGFKHCH